MRLLTQACASLLLSVPGFRAEIKKIMGELNGG
jgi:hypothetical protein